MPIRFTIAHGERASPLEEIASRNIGPTYYNLRRFRSKYQIKRLLRGNSARFEVHAVCQTPRRHLDRFRSNAQRSNANAHWSEVFACFRRADFTNVITNPSPNEAMPIKSGMSPRPRNVVRSQLKKGTAEKTTFTPIT